MSIAGIALVDAMTSAKKPKRSPDWESAFEDDYGNNWNADFFIDDDGDGCFTVRIASVCFNGHDLPLDAVRNCIREILIDQARDEYAESLEG